MAEVVSHDDLFRWFVIQQQQMVMIHLGKLVHPVTGQIERDLDAARISIDILGMLEAKTKGNLLPADESLLGQVLTTLRLNFVEERSKPETAEERDRSSQGPEGPAPEGGASTERATTSEGETTSQTDEAKAGPGE